MKNNQKPELLAPAGNFERLRAALHYGADAVYCGGKRLSLRAFAGNFDLDELAQACAYTHARQKKLYLALNSYMHQSDLVGLKEYVASLVACGIDALIVSDPGALLIAREAAPALPLHLSTQANALNGAALRFWYDNGIRRVILARECLLADLAAMRRECPPDMELEAFVHGAMCISYSGRCLLSNFMDQRDGNRGACTQVCRREFELREKGQDGAYYPVEEDGRGTYLLNSRDMNMIEDVGALTAAGVTSFKIEGRMKTAFYVATVVNAYRMAIDDWAADKAFDPALLQELDAIKHRPYCKGFYYAEDTAEIRESQRENVDPQGATFIALVLSYDESTRRALVEQRNRFFVEDEIEVLSPGHIGKKAVIGGIWDMDGINRQSAPHPQERVWLDLPPVKPGDMLRKKNEEGTIC